MNRDEPDVLPESDRRGLRLYDLGPHESLEIRCECGWVTTFFRGLLQRQHRIPSDMLVYDLQYRMKCRNCNRSSGFEIAILDERDRATTTKDKPMRRTIIVPKEGWS